jgi:hypothetical protein
MPIQEYETQDAIPEDVRDKALALADGKYAVFIEEDVSGLKANHDRLLAEKKAADARKREADAELARLRQEMEAKAAGLTDEQLKKLRADAAKEYEPIVAEREKYAAELRALKLDAAVKNEFAKSGVRGERLEALWRLTSDRFDLTEDGKPYIPERPGSEVAKYVTDALKTEYPEFFAGTAADGGGASGSRGGGTASNGDPRGWTPAQRADYIEANGMDAFRKAMEQAVRNAKK